MVKEKALVTRVLEAGRRNATVLEQEQVRIVIDDDGGMVPELSALTEKKSRINAHWNPWFRGNAGKPFNRAEHGDFWKARLLYQIAGSFPCLPNFGGDHVVDGIDMPAHGWTANDTWRLVKTGVDEESGAAWALSVMESPEKLMPLSFKKLDLVIPGHPVHYTSITVKIGGLKDIDIAAGWHNTAGAPFLMPGSYSTPPGKDGLPRQRAGN
ncbi:MAG: hypothetical protein LBF77_06485, partial [Spirochaetaceae bacterium]|nr:hypothetical protein [Spirochaetaceae bacterium]